MKPLQSSLIDEVLESLDTFLADPVRQDTTLDVATLEGLLVTPAVAWKARLSASINNSST
jgi:hypothetical protein